jgi:hypothetical protein
VSVTAEILGLWRAPRARFRARLDEGAREERALAMLMGACLMSFLAQWPALARAAHLDPSVPLQARIGGALMGAVFLLPLVAYGIAAVSQRVARALGGQGTGYGARLALFWAWAASVPGILFYGLAAGLAPGLATTILGGAVFLGFAGLWLTLLREANRGVPSWT